MSITTEHNTGNQHQLPGEEGTTEALLPENTQERQPATTAAGVVLLLLHRVF